SSLLSAAPVNFNAGGHIVAHITRSGVGVVAVLPGPVIIEPPGSALLTDTLEPLDHVGLQELSECHCRGLDETGNMLVELKEVLLLLEILPELLLGESNAW
ncbi:MAG: hypothetical protein ACK53Y_19285, partial [bacterium]